jgi:Copper type II ascorbate-dependent monooxygenase, C-terminal domain
VHMHLRGKSAKLECFNKGGSSEVLMNLPHYDFNWQLSQDLVSPLPIKAGDKLKFTAIYDNSVNNPANPNPNQIVRWGAQTYEEMMITYLEYY